MSHQVLLEEDYTLALILLYAAARRGLISRSLAQGCDYSGALSQ
ncbi:hypothetical protein [Sodalis-like endosymbiont of Proechinophthirus fluctus]|nr:hypothetical protein [Sodalis-like endosymbiont of Proechinophthirus fluctus]